MKSDSAPISLAAAGIDPAAAQQGGQLELRINTEVYLLDGHGHRRRHPAAKSFLRAAG